MYDRQEVYEKHVKKKAKELDELCKTLGISAFMSFCVKDDKTNTEYHNFINGSISNGVYLTDDQITKHVNVANGFMVIPPENTDSFDDEEEDFDL